MTGQTGASYEITVKGGLNEAVAAAIAERGLDATVRAEHIVLRGLFIDLAELNVFLFNLDDLGLVLVSIHQVR